MIWMLPSLDGLVPPYAAIGKKTNAPHVSIGLRAPNGGIRAAARYTVPISRMAPFPPFHSNIQKTEQSNAPLFHQKENIRKKNASRRRSNQTCDPHCGRFHLAWYKLLSHKSDIINHPRCNIPRHRRQMAALNSHTGVFGSLHDGLRYGHAKSPQKRFCGLPCVLGEFCKHSLPGQI